MLSHDAELRAHADRLLDQVGPLHTICLLGFTEGDQDRVEANVRNLAVGQDPWTFLDLRDVAQEPAREALRAHAEDPVLLIVARHDRLSRPIINLVRAAVDRSPRFELGDLVPVERRRDQSVLLVLEEPEDRALLSSELRRIPYKDLIQ